VSERREVGSKGFIVVSNGTLNFNIFCDITRGDWVAINYFNNFWVFELITRKVVLACESLIHKGKSSASAIHKCMGVNFDITVRQGTWYDWVISIHFILLFT
jgi:hypothetical protein